MVTGPWLMWTCSLVTIQLNSISLLESKTPKYTTGTTNVRMHLHPDRFATMLYCWVGQTARVIAASPWLLFELRYIVMTTTATTIWVAGQARPARRWNVSSASGQKETFSQMLDTEQERHFGCPRWQSTCCRAEFILSLCYNLLFSPPSFKLKTCYS